MSDGAWQRWEHDLARYRERSARQHQPLRADHCAPAAPALVAGRREHAVWLTLHVLSALGLAFSTGWAAHRDGLLSPYVLGDSLVLLCTLAVAALRLQMLLADARCHPAR